MKFFKIFLLYFVLFSCNDNPVEFTSPANPFSDFAKFLSLVPEADLPYELSFEDLKARNYNLFLNINLDSPYYKRIPLLREPIPKRYSPHQPLDFSRMTLIDKFIGIDWIARIPPSVSPIFKFQPIEDKYAVVYAYDSSSSRGLYLRTFNENGKELETFELTNEWYTRTFISSINSNGIIIQREYENIWKRDFENHRFENNEVVDHKLINVRYYKIDKNGHFELIEDYSDTDEV